MPFGRVLAATPPTAMRDPPSCPSVLPSHSHTRTHTSRQTNVRLTRSSDSCHPAGTRARFQSGRRRRRPGPPPRHPSAPTDTARGPRPRGKAPARFPPAPATPRLAGRRPRGAASGSVVLLLLAVAAVRLALVQPLQQVEPALPPAPRHRHGPARGMRALTSRPAPSSGRQQVPSSVLDREADRAVRGRGRGRDLGDLLPRVDVVVGRKRLLRLPPPPPRRPAAPPPRASGPAATTRGRAGARSTLTRQ